MNACLRSVKTCWCQACSITCLAGVRLILEVLYYIDYVIICIKVITNIKIKRVHKYTLLKPACSLISFT